MPDEALAFIHNRPLQAGEQETNPTNSTEKSARTRASAAMETTSHADEAQQKVRSRPTRKSAREGDLHPAEDRPSLLGEVRVPLTTRLQPATADALRRANLEQRLKRLRPATQQEIVEMAVHDWLQRNGYFSSQ